MPVAYTDEGVPYSEAFGDIYFSMQGGPEETGYVFLQGNNLPKRWQSAVDFTIAETGFGTGLNFLSAWKLWQECGGGGVLRFISLEKFPLTGGELAGTLSLWPQLSVFTDQLVRDYPSSDRGRHIMYFDEGSVELVLLMGDAYQMLQLEHFRADAWFLDGFSPAKNPDMWSAQLCNEIGRLTAPGGTFATYTVAAQVRENLQQAGFEVERVPGFGRKRHMLQGMKHV